MHNKTIAQRAKRPPAQAQLADVANANARIPFSQDGFGGLGGGLGERDYIDRVGFTLATTFNALKLFTGLLEELTSLRLLGFLVRYTRFHRQYPIVSPINGCTQYVPGPGASQLSLQERRPVFGS